ncbi:MAG TPA: PPC domain-containing protein [Gemmataceae bacterium]|nr:PPC domain-containing protein [Gemmataceae bacterium]
MFRTLLIACTLASVVAAAPPTVESVLPAAGQRGTEFTLTLTGARLANPEELLLYSPGVTCTKLSATSENEVTATLKAAADCRLGEYAFRLRTPGGASEVRTFRVSPFPVVAEKEPNDSLKEAQAVPLNVSVTGVIEAGGADHYAVTLKKGQRLAAEVEAVRLGGELTDAVLTVFGPDGRELIAVDDTPLFRQDPFITLLAPADGVYTVRVRESGAGGGDTSRYILHLGTFTRPAAVFPAGGPAGTEVSVRLLGDAAGARTQTIKLPASGEVFEFRPTDGSVPAPTPNPFRVSPFPNVIEAEPNDDPAHATANPHGWPVAFNGVIDRVEDLDHYRFKAAKGDVIEVSAFAYRIGSPLDPVVAVLTAAGELLAANDDDETHDSRVCVTIPADGEYLVRVSDKSKRGGPAFIYRVELDRPKPRLDVFLASPLRNTQNRQLIAVPRGNRVAAYLAVRRDGVSGPVMLTTGDLPKGVHLDLRQIPEGEYLLPVVFEASLDAPIGGKLVDIRGTCSSVTGAFRQEVNLTPGPGDSAFHSVTLSKLAVVVVEEAPVSISVVPPAGPAPVDGTLDVKVQVNRAKEFAEPLEVSFPCLPPGIEAPGAVIVPADKDEVIVTLVVHPAAEAGDWKLMAEVRTATARASRDPLAAPPMGMGMGMGGGRRRSRKSAPEFQPVAAPLVAIRVAEPPVKGKFDLVAAEQGRSTRVTCQFDRPAPANFTAKLDGLPPRAKADSVEVKAGDRAATFAVSVDPTTPPGSQPALVCELAGEVGGRKVVYRVGRGGVFTVNVPGSVKTDATGKPLSPLEALRLSEKK